LDYVTRVSLLSADVSRQSWQRHLGRLSSIESLALPEGIDRTIHQNRLLKLAREGRKLFSECFILIALI
jgi:hypothetical protein